MSLKNISTSKEGIYEENGVLIVKGIEYINRIASALASRTRLEILKLVKRKKELDIGEIADYIDQSRANASAQIKRLEDVGLIRTSYKPGQRGVKKICWTNIKEIRIILE